MRQRFDSVVRDLKKVIGGKGSQLYGKLGRCSVRKLVGVDLHPEPGPARRTQDRRTESFSGPRPERPWQDLDKREACRRDWRGSSGCCQDSNPVDPSRPQTTCQIECRIQVTRKWWRDKINPKFTRLV